MIIVSENNFWQVCWSNPQRTSLVVISKWRKNRGVRNYRAFVKRDKLGRIIVDSKFEIPVNVRNWCTKALLRGFRFR